MGELTKEELELNKRVKGMVKEVLLSGKAADIAAEEAAVKEEAYAKMCEKVKGLEDAEEARKNSKGQKMNLETPGSDGKVEVMYKGFDMRRQAMDITLAEGEHKTKASKYMLSVLEGADEKALTLGSTSGQILSPDEFGDTIMGLAKISSVALRECRVFGMSRDVMKIPVEATGTSVDIQGYGTANTESTPTLTEVSITPKRLGNYSLINNDMLEDSKFDVVSWCFSNSAEAWGQAVDEYVFIGSSFTNSLYAGITSNIVTVSGSAGTVADLTYNDLSLAIRSLDQVKAQGAKFYFNRAVAHELRGQEDTAGNLIWSEPWRGQNQKIYGYDYVEVPKLTAAPAADGKFGVFGNLKHYYIGTRLGMRMSINKTVLEKEGQTQLILHGRVDGTIGIQNALCLIKLAA